jgi:serine/threonine protein kinase
MSRCSGSRVTAALRGDAKKAEDLAHTFKELQAAIQAGSRLGPYEIVSRLGAGGMGEVYRARDTRLDRVVAIKVLPSELAADPDRRSRLEREARAVSAGPAFAAGRPHLVFEGAYLSTIYDISPDGGSCLMIKAGDRDPATAQVNVILDWIPDLARRVPAAR